MELSKIKLSIREVVAVCAIVFALGGGAVMLKSLTSEVSGLGVLVTGLSLKVSELKFEQTRINMIVNFLYAEGFKAGWKPTEFDTDVWAEHMEAGAKQ